MSEDLEFIGDSLERCFLSSNVVDANGESANVTDTIDRAARNLNRIASAILPSGVVGFSTPHGGRVDSLTEAVIYAAQSLESIAESINRLADAVRERSE